MQSVSFIIPGVAAKVNYLYPVDLIMAFLPHARGPGVGSLWIDYTEIKDRVRAQVLYGGHQPVASVVFLNRADDGTTEGWLFSEMPEYFEMLKRALEEFLLETQMVPA